MPFTEAQLLSRIKNAEEEISSQKTNMTWYRKCISETESRLIEAKISKEKLEEELSRLRDSTNTHELTLREKEIEGFQLRNPEICQMAKDRDKAPEEDDNNGRGS